MSKYTFTILILIFFTPAIVKAQTPDVAKPTKTAPAIAKDTADKKDTVKHKKSSLKIGLTYSSNSVYLARTDSIATPNYGLGITYTLKSGIYFSGEVNYIPSRQFDKLDAGNLEAGYNFDLSDNLSGGVSVSKYIASFNSTQVISAIDATVGAELSYDLFDAVSASVHGDYALVRSDGNDIIITGGLSHEFEFEKVFTKGDRLSIEPKAELTAGTQNFLSSYYVLKHNSAAKRQQHQNAKAKGLAKTTSTSSSSSQTTSVTSNSNKFQTLAYEFSLPVSYSWKKFGVSFTPAYAIAVHKITDDGSTTAYLPNSSVFYFQVGVSYTF